MKFYASFLALILSCCFSCGFAEEALRISSGTYTTSYNRERLLKSPKLTTLKQVPLPTYPGQFFDLKAVPLCTLLTINEKNTGTVLKILASDKYLSYINLQRIYPCDKKRSAIAYIAIEESDKPWPLVPKIKHSAGPFYLVWQGAKVEQTDWIFGVMAISVTDKNPFSKLLPMNSTGLEAQGLEIFAGKCGVCHSINLIGNLEIGPDLNVPMNPTEYFSEKHLRQFIRNPQSVRYMKNDKMFAFTKNILSEQELDALIAFLKLMQHHKGSAPPKMPLS